MKISELKIGDKIRIVAVPGEGIKGYTIHPETVQVYKDVIARKRSVRISKIDEYGRPWYNVQFKVDGHWDWHSLCIMSSDTNWVPVKKRNNSKD